MSFVKNYDPGKIHMDLPTSNYIYELPLLSFSDIHGAVNLSLIFNYRMKEEQGNPFHIAPGYKLNLQKRLIMENNIPVALQSEDGNCTDIISTGGVYVLDNDDQRILRRNGTNYVLENMDYSKEVYDSTGKIVSAYDKYGNVVLSYGYNSSGQLTSVTYRSSKTITLTYSNGWLEKINYAGCGTSFVHNYNELIVEHYSGMGYRLMNQNNLLPECPEQPWLDFHAEAVALGNPNETYTTELKRSRSYQLDIVNKIFRGTEEAVIASATYVFSDDVACNRSHSYIEITNDTGVATRLQYQGRNLCCSYEISGEDATFASGRYKGSVQIYRAMNEEDSPDVSGALEVYNSVFTFVGGDARWEASIPSELATVDNGCYVLTGWIRSREDAEDSNDNALIITNVTNVEGEQPITLHPTLAPENKWSFFVYKFYLPGTWIKVFGNVNNLELNDVRMALYSTDIPNGNYASNAVVAEDILIAHDSTEDVILPLCNCTFKMGATQLADKGVASYNDLLKYKLNQAKQINTGEFYCNHGKEVHTVLATASIAVHCKGNTYNLANCYLGKRQYTRNGIFITKITDDGSNLIYQVEKAGGAVISSQTLNDYLDVISATVDGVTTTYTRTQDLITAETVPNLYTRTTAYSTDSDGNPVITATDEYGQATEYTLDPTWGTVVQVLFPDGSMIADSYNNRMCTLIDRAFIDRNDHQLNEFAYSNGQLSGLRMWNIDYSFTYNNRGQLTSVSKNETPTEVHHYSDDDTRVQSYYPSESGALHSVDATFDAYGKLLSVAGVLTNTYDVWPAFDSDTGALNGRGNGRNALLATSTDELRGETARFTYGESTGLLKEKEVTSKTSYATKISTEEFEYDDLNRLKIDTCTYQGSNKVTSQIAYVTEVDNPNADNRVSGYVYSINDASAATTSTLYDNYKRPNSKIHYISGVPFRKEITYQATRLATERDYMGGVTSVNYDACGRVQKVATANIPTQYTYDRYGQLIREDNQALAKSFVYEYNDHGCVIAVKAYNYTTGDLSGTPATTAFDYDRDKLTSFGGATIAYNAIGCPTTYDGKSLGWTKGKLTNMSKGSRAEGLEGYSFTYNAYGQRVSKSYSYLPGTSSLNPIYVGQTLTANKQFYYDHSGRLVAETFSGTYYNADARNEKIVFLYDGNTIIGMQHTVNGVTTPYYFHRNPLGDVVGIYNTSGTQIAKYIYDAWGNCTISGNAAVAKANPIRYRGYYYDDDTGLYYCNARYYSPKWRRFISPETSALNPYAVNGLNTYVYAGNNPVGLSYIFSQNTSVTPNSQFQIAQNNSLSNSVAASAKMHIARSKSNKVLMTHHTMSLLGNAQTRGLFGGLSYTVTTQLNEAKGFYSYSNVGNSWASYGVGMNWGDWYGMNVYVSENIGIGTSTQLTPWFTFGAELSWFEGISLSAGIISGNTTHEISANIGWGTIAGAYAFAAAMAFVPTPGARALAGAMACLIFIVDLFN